MLMFKWCHFLCYKLAQIPSKSVQHLTQELCARNGKGQNHCVQLILLQQNHCSWFACFHKPFNRIFKNLGFERGSVQSRVIPLGLFLTPQEEHNSARKGEQDSCNSILWWHASKKRETPDSMCIWRSTQLSPISKQDNHPNKTKCSYF